MERPKLQVTVKNFADSRRTFVDADQARVRHGALIVDGRKGKLDAGLGGAAVA
jgi:hypothetical protein